MQLFLIVLVGWLSILLVSIEAKVAAARYDDFKVYRLNIADDQQLNELKKLPEDLPVRILNELKGAGYSNYVAIDPAYQRKLETRLRYLEFDFICVIEDLQSILEEEHGHYSNTFQNNQSSSKHNDEEPEMNWNQYQNLSVIYKWLDKLPERYPQLVTIYTIGFSYEKRPIKAIKISAKSGNKAVFMDSSIHAIEWISSMATSNFFETLLSSTDEEMIYLREHYDWVYVAVVNPDGFEYSHKVERLWRKNRKPTGFSNSSGPCYGVDLNRNFDSNWGVNAYNYDVPCDHWYAGAQSNTEPEVLALQKFIRSLGSKYIKIYTAVHSFGNMFLLPYGHTDKEFPPNYDQMMQIATEGFADSAKKLYGTQFRCGASSIVNYNVSGSAKDWAYSVMGIPFTGTIELRDRGTYGFILPSNQIPEVCAEFNNGIMGMVRKADELGLFK